MLCCVKLSFHREPKISFCECALNDYIAIFRECTTIKKDSICIDNILITCKVMSRENTIIVKETRPAFNNVKPKDWCFVLD